MKIAVPIIHDGSSDPSVGQGWGRADWVAIADITDGQISDWQEIEVSWDKLHDEGTHGSHHARISKFLTSNGVTMVVADHMGDGMLRMLDTMKITIALGAAGSAEEAVKTAITLTAP